MKDWSKLKFCIFMSVNLFSCVFLHVCRSIVVRRDRKLSCVRGITAGHPQGSVGPFHMRPLWKPPWAGSTHSDFIVNRVSLPSFYIVCIPNHQSSHIFIDHCEDWPGHGSALDALDMKLRPLERYCMCGRLQWLPTITSDHLPQQPLIPCAPL